ncbi:MAG: AbrB/MazE/SpoVT family DNA-binding domain-containing protein [Pseudomonas sp.]
MQVRIRKIGNSRGVVIPKPLLSQIGLEDEAVITVEGGAIVLRRAAKPVRAGWAEAARKMARAGDDELVMPDFLNEADVKLTW